MSVTFLQSLTSRPKHSLDQNTFKLAVYSTGIGLQILYIGFLIPMTLGQVNFVTCPMPIICKTMWEIKYLKYLSDLLKSLIMMMNEARDDISGATLH